MFRPKTLFIIGAGSSKELRLPLGGELKDRIADRLRLEQAGADRIFADRAIDSAVRAYVDREPAKSRDERIERYRKAANIIIGALPLAQSIDNLLNAHSGSLEVERLGKLGITSAIIRAEHESALGRGYGMPHSDPSESRQEVVESWYPRLASLLFSGARKGDVNTLFESVIFVIFNYDRCLELFLHHAVRTYFGLDEDEAVAAVRRARFIHPYGQVGMVQLIAVSKRIKTFSESADSAVRDEISNAVSEAETLIFMGFGFIDQNMELLRAGSAETAVKRVFLTSYGISESDVPIVIDRIGDIIGKWERSKFPGKFPHFSAHVERGTCADLMDNHRFRITRADRPSA